MALPIMAFPSNICFKAVWLSEGWAVTDGFSAGLVVFSVGGGHTLFGLEGTSTTGFFYSSFGFGYGWGFTQAGTGL